MRYDVAIIGAGVNGLTAAATLARAGLKTVVIERGLHPGGRLITGQFHPGFFASVFADRVPHIPSEVAQAVGLVANLNVEDLPDDLRLRREGALAKIFEEARSRHSRGILGRLWGSRTPISSLAFWPGQDLAQRKLTDWPHLSAWALLGRATDPELTGSALTLLALAGAEPVHGGLGALGEAFTLAARGAEMRLGAEASEVTIRRRRLINHVAGVVLANGEHIQADAVISTLDLKQTIFSLFPWAALAPAMTSVASHFRMGGGTARLLLALKRKCAISAPMLLPGDGQARSAFRRGAIPKNPPLLIDPVSVRDASLAPADAATLTVTISGIPLRLFDGAWTHDRRMRLAAGVLCRIEAAMPGTMTALSGLRVIVPPDIEQTLAASSGDLDGGLLAPDQMLSLRPAARTPLDGFYLGGASCAAGPLGTGAAGFAAATSLLADRAGSSWI